MLSVTHRNTFLNVTFQQLKATKYHCCWGFGSEFTPNTWNNTKVKTSVDVPAPPTAHLQCPAPQSRRFGVNLSSSSCDQDCGDLLVSRPSSMSALIIAGENNARHCGTKGGLSLNSFLHHLFQMFSFNAHTHTHRFLCVVRTAFTNPRL